jgi:predicted GTPase/uncharacterized protein (DUF697 family)
MESHHRTTKQLMEEKVFATAVGSVLEHIKAPNIALIGKTGTGKSSLINAVFGTELAETGAGLPITKGFHLYQNSLINIYDSPGYEVGIEKDFVSDLINFIHDQELFDTQSRIHLVWYLINASSGRIEHFDLEIISQLYKHKIPFVIVLSQADRARPEEIENLQSTLQNLDIAKDFDVIKVAASPIMMRGKLICEPFGLQELVAITIEKLPEIYADSVRTAQVVDLKPKRELVWKLIAAAATATFGVGAVPFAITGTTTALAVQTSLLVSIASVYRFGDMKSLIPLIYKNMISITALGMIGGVMLSDVLKSTIPVVGNIIAGSTSAAFVVITGMACASAFESLAKAHIDPDNSKEIEDFFIKSYKRNLEQYSGLNIRTTKDLEKVKNNFIDNKQQDRVTSVLKK